MKLHRFIIDLELKVENIKVINKEFFNQIRNVLKLRVGEKIVLCDGNNTEGITEIKGYGKNMVELEIQEISSNQNEPERGVVLYCAILKKENFEWVVQKATEVGVKEIVPIITAHTIKLDIRKDRLEKIIKEAAEQSGRGVVPTLYEPIYFEQAVIEAKNQSFSIIFDQSGENINSSKLRTNNYELITVFIGPEGGWHADEIQHVLSLPKEHNFKIVSLGKTTLRAETAAIVGSYLAIHTIHNL